MQKVSDTLRAMLKNCWKCILHCISTIVSNIRNLKVFCDAYTVKRLGTVVQKKRNTPIYFNTNYRREMKLVPIIMDYCLL